MRALPIALALAISAPAARADPRTGAYERGTVGFAYGGWRVQTGSFTGDAWSEGVQGSVALGWAVADGLAVAAEGRALVQGGSTSSYGTGWGPVFVLAEGGLIDYYPFASKSIHVDLGFAAMHASAAVECAEVLVGNDTQSGPTCDTFDSLSGVFAHTGIGWSWPVGPELGLGPSLGVYRGRASRGRAHFDVYGASLELALTWL